MKCPAIRGRHPPLVMQMTFIIEAIKDDRRLSEIRSSADIAVSLARRLAAQGFEVSISAPTGDLYPAEKFDLLLTTDLTGMAGDGSNDQPARMREQQAGRPGN